MADFIKDLYEKFLLRDILSFITPGAIIASSVLLVCYDPSELLQNLREIHWILYIPIFGFLYLLGAAVQSFGAKFLPIVLRLHPIIKLHRLLSDKDSCNYDVLLNFHKVRKQPFQKIAHKDKDRNISQMHERLVVFKQMCGNCALAILIATIILCIKYFSPALLITGLVVATLLYCGHIHSVREESALEEAILEEVSKQQE